MGGQGLWRVLKADWPRPPVDYWQNSDRTKRFLRIDVLCMGAFIGFFLLMIGTHLAR